MTVLTVVVNNTVLIFIFAIRLWASPSSTIAIPFFRKRKAAWPNLAAPPSRFCCADRGYSQKKGWCSSETDCEGRPGPVKLSWALGLVIYHCQMGEGGKKHRTVPAHLLTDSWRKPNATSRQIICHRGGMWMREILYHRLHAASPSKLLTSSQGKKKKRNVSCALRDRGVL